MTNAIGSIRHLVYHLYPQQLDSGAVWRKNVAMLRRRLSLFNGRRVVAVAIGKDTDPLDAVQAAFDGCHVELIPVKNVATKRECTSLVKLYEVVAGYVSPEHVTLHAHGKGITSEAWATGGPLWRDALYETCLDYWPKVEMMLQVFPIVGPFKRHYTDWKSNGFKSKSTWHFSGAWRWFRNADLFARDWKKVEPFWCGSESHPSMVFDEEEAGNLVCPVPPKGQCLYERSFWDSTAGPAMEVFRAENASYKQEPRLLTCILTSHRKPARVREAIASIQAQSSPDWQLIVIDSGDLVEELRPYELDPRIVVLRSQETDELRGRVGIQAWCINECFRRGHVRGDLVCYLCDDDRYHPNAFADFHQAARACLDQSAWCGRADLVELKPDGSERKAGQLGTHAVGTLLDCKVDGMQVCHRRAVRVEWPEDRTVAWHADGMMLRALGERTSIHPLACCVGEHRHTPESTFTRSTANGLQEVGRD